MSSQDQPLQRLQAMATIASSIAIPIVLAVTGYLVQRQLSAEGLKKDYVAIAVGILNTSSQGQEPDLRRWAVTVLDANAPIPFSAKAKQLLERGSSLAVVVPPPAIPAPPAICMEPPKERRILQAYTAMAKKAEAAKNPKELTELLFNFAELVRAEEEDAGKAIISLACMQSWAKVLVGGEELRKELGSERTKAENEQFNTRAAASGPTTLPPGAK